MLGKGARGGAAARQTRAPLAAKASLNGNLIWNGIVMCFVVWQSEESTPIGRMHDFACERKRAAPAVVTGRRRPVPLLSACRHRRASQRASAPAAQPLSLYERQSMSTRCSGEAPRAAALVPWPLRLGACVHTAMPRVARHTPRLDEHAPPLPSHNLQVVREERSDGAVKLTVTIPGGLVQRRFTEIVDILRRCGAGTHVYGLKPAALFVGPALRSCCLCLPGPNHAPA